MNRTITILQPSRSRAKQAEKTARLWLENASNPENIEYIICLDTSDPKGGDYREYFSDPKFKKCIKDNHSAIEAINNGAKESTGDIIIVCSDDFSCKLGWDVRLLKELEGKEDFLVKTPDGLQKTLVTLPLMDRTYYSRFGYIYNEAYRHLFSDQEMTSVAIMLGKLIYVDILFEHEHHSTGKNQKDAISQKCDATWNQGKKVFHERLKNNFGIKNPLVKYSDIVW